MLGKEKCKALKEIRKKIAEENDIAYVVSECTYQGECKGTCPKCEEELRYLEKELEKRRKLGKVAIILGVAAGVCGGLMVAADAASDYLQEEIEESVTAGIVSPTIDEGDE